MEPVDHAVRPRSYPRAAAVAADDLRVSHIKGNEALDVAYADSSRRPSRSGVPLAEDPAAGAGRRLHDQDRRPGRLSGYARKLKGQTDYAGILQLWDL